MIVQTVMKYSKDRAENFPAVIWIGSLVIQSMFINILDS